MSWTKEYSDKLSECVTQLFKVYEVESARSRAVSTWESNPEVFLKRITPQILEVYSQGLGYLTPEEWDESFRILGGGRSRRGSASILERLTWDQFLYNFEIIVKNSL